MKLLLANYIQACETFWKETAPALDNSHCTRKRECINTVKDFDCRYIQPATNELAAARIISNIYLLQSILPPVSSSFYTTHWQQCQKLINVAYSTVNQLQPASL
jgi:hypothetical protein